MDPNDGMGFDNYRILEEIQVLDKASLEIDYIYKGVRTKPNALNVGLQNAKGDMLITYSSNCLLFCRLCYMC